MKKYLLLCLTLCASLWANAQATDLEVDCQTPGWLSSMINYGDQLTVKRLKVTGYINGADLSFIGTLMQKNLKERLDLSEANITGVDGKDDYMGKDSFGVGAHISYLSLPKSLKDSYAILSYKNNGHWIRVDTLYLDWKKTWMNLYDIGGIVNRLELGENIDSIPTKRNDDPPNYWEAYVSGIQSLHLSSNIRYIGDKAFGNTTGNPITEVNFEDFNNLYYLGDFTFSSYVPDTIRIPNKLTRFYYYSIGHKDGQHIYIDNNISAVDCGNNRVQFGMLYFHINNQIPPALYLNIWYSDMSKVTVYVPKGAKSAYENSSWYGATIIEVNPVEMISLSEHEITLDIGETCDLSVMFAPEDADDKSVFWTSLDEDVATINTAGKVKAVGSGQTKIFVTSVPTGVQDSCIVTVRTNPTDVELNSTSITLNDIGQTYQLEATVLPESATEKGVTWTSSNEQVCVVSSTGLVTATGAGTALITVTTVDGGLTATCLVKVIQHVSSMILDKTTLTLKVGEADRLQVTVLPDNADNKNVTWSSSDEQLATVDTEGNVKALKTGEVWITATSEDNPEVKASCKVTITQPVNDVTISQAVVDLTNIGESIQLEATVLPEDASDKSVIWKTTNEQVCIASSTGLVVATGAGTAVVTVTTNDGGKMAFCVVNVSDTSGVLEIQSECTDAVPVFDTMGRRVKELKKGQLYIRNGKKFISR